MPQIFTPGTNWIARAAFISAPLALLVSIGLAEGIDRSDFVTEVGQFINQPVPFSHQHHVSQLRIDCRYCHTQVERGAVAQIPPTEICMTCHSQIWSRSPVLEPVRESFRTGEPLRWQKVTKIPDFVFFNHSIHVQKGVSCFACHGDVQNMPLTYLAHPMQMQFCIGCHRHPEPFLRPLDQVTQPFYQPTRSQEDIGAELAMKYQVESKTDCITCHR